MIGHSGSRFWSVPKGTSFDLTRATKPKLGRSAPQRARRGFQGKREEARNLLARIHC